MFGYLLAGQAVEGEPGSLRIGRCRKQADGYSCGVWVLLWMEAEYRQLRGEGPMLLQADWPARRTNWNRFIAKLRKHKADKETAAEAATKKAVEPVPAGSLALVPVSAEAAEPGPPVPPGSKQDATGSWGCSRCRHSKAGCLSCNPAKMLRCWEQPDKQ